MVDIQDKRVLWCITIRLYVMDIYSSVHKYTWTVSTWEITEWIFNTITTQHEMSESNSLLQSWRRRRRRNLPQPVHHLFCASEMYEILTTGTNCGFCFFPKMLMLYKHIRESCRTINRTGLEVSISSCTDLWPLICVCVWGNGGEISCTECVCVCS